MKKRSKRKKLPPKNWDVELSKRKSTGSEVSSKKESSRSPGFILIPA